MSQVYKGPRRDAREAAKVAERMAKPVPASAVAKRRKAAKRLSLCLKPRALRGVEDAPNWKDTEREHIKLSDDELSGKVKWVSSEGKTFAQSKGEYSSGEWVVGPDGQAVWKSTEGYDAPNGKRSVVAIEGRIHNTPVGSKVATARPDSPFKRAKAKATTVVIVRK